MAPRDGLSERINRRPLTRGLFCGGLGVVVKEERGENRLFVAGV